MTGFRKFFEWHEACEGDNFRIPNKAVRFEDILGLTPTPDWENLSCVVSARLQRCSLAGTLYSATAGYWFVRPEFLQHRMEAYGTQFSARFFSLQKQILSPAHDRGLVLKRQIALGMETQNHLRDAHRSRIMKLAVVHDLAEALAGDIAPFQDISKEDKRRLEEEGLEEICATIGSDPIGG